MYTKHDDNHLILIKFANPYHGSVQHAHIYTDEQKGNVYLQSLPHTYNYSLNEYGITSKRWDLWSRQSILTLQHFLRLSQVRNFLPLYVLFRFPFHFLSCCWSICGYNVVLGPAAACLVVWRFFRLSLKTHWGPWSYIFFSFQRGCCFFGIFTICWINWCSTRPVWWPWHQPTY